MSKNTKGILDTINSINKWKTRVIVWLCGIAIAAVLIVLMVLTMGARVEEIVKAYETLSGSPQNSKQQFATRGTIITYDDKGRPTIQLATAVNEQDGGVNGIGDADPGTPGGDGDSGGSGDGGDPPPDDFSFELDINDLVSSVSFGTVGVKANDVLGVGIYAGGIPWPDDGKWYVMKNDVAFDYLENIFGLSPKSKTSFHEDNKNTTTPITHNNVPCMGIAWLPTFCFLSTDADGNFSGEYSGAVCDQFYGAVKVRHEGIDYFIPICSGGDNKGHTFPGGVAQTYVAHETKADVSNNTITLSSGTSKYDIARLYWGSTPMHNLSMSITDFRNNYASSVYYDNALISTLHPSKNIETNIAFGRELAKYEIVEFYLHKN